MTDKFPQRMADKGSLRDPSNMVSNSHRVLYAAITLAVLALAGFTAYSVSDSAPPNQTPPTSMTQ